MPDPLVWAFAIYAATCARTLVHELGHALLALRLTTTPVVVLVGRPLAILRLGRLSLGLGLGTTGGVCHFIKPPTTRGYAAIAAAGPVASLLLALVAAAVFVVTGPPLFSGAGVFLTAIASAGCVDAAVNGWPRRRAGSIYGDGANDGYVVARLMGWISPGAFIIGPAPAPRGAPPTAAPREGPPIMRSWAAALLALVFVIALLVAPEMALLLVVLFGFAGLLIHEDQHAERLVEAHRGGRTTIR